MISLCVIAKNEAHCIARMVESARGLVSEIIVIDTGSTDGTQEIATALGAIVSSYKWQDDFAEARNVSLSLATQPWILILDADEELSPESSSIISELVAGKPMAYSLDRYHFSWQPDASSSKLVPPEMPAYARGARAYFRTHDIRLFPNDSRIRFVGAVHESAEDSLYRLGIPSERCPAIIYHYGHLIGEERKREKALQYLALAHRKVRDNPEDWRTWYHLGVELQNHAKHHDAAQAFERARSIFPTFAPLLRQLAISRCLLGDYPTGLEIFSQALSTDSSCLLTWNALGAAFIDLGQLDQAQQCFQTIVGADPHNPVAQEALGLIQRRRALAE
jgi:tetratricopeptide (TPR) repeat protein